MFLRIVFLFVFFPLSQGQADSSQENFDCRYYNSDEPVNAYTYRFNPGVIENKVNPVKKLVEENAKRNYEGGVAPSSSVANRKDAPKCSFNAEIARAEIESIRTTCHFNEIVKICKKAGEKAFDKTCGKKAPCHGGLFIEAKNMAEAKKITPENLRLALDKRNEIARTLIDFKKGYEKCAEGVRRYILNNVENGMNLCTDAYDFFIDNRRKEMAAKNCSVTSIENYITIFKGVMKKEGFHVQYQEIKNSHVMARVCTLKLLSAFNQLDKALDNFYPKRKTASQKVPLAN